MDIRPYLPSAQFSVLLGALLISGGLVYGAEYVNHPHTSSGSLEDTSGGAPQNQLGVAYTNWQDEVGSSTVLATDNAIALQAQQLVEGVATNNLTDTVGRSLLINTMSAQGQGLGSDQPTQDQIMGDALSQIEQAPPSAKVYTSADITTVPDSKTALHTYGNTLATLIAAHPKASANATMAIVGLAIDEGNGSTLPTLDAVAKEYRALAKAVIQTPVPVQLSSFAVNIANNYVAIAATCATMELVQSDPLKGLAGVEAYNTLNTQNGKVFTQINSTFQNNGILFTTGDSGQAWNNFAVAFQAQQAQEAQAQQAQQLNPTSP